MSDLTPTYIYKIIPTSAAPPNPLPERLPVSQLDETDGFLHLSTAKQVPNTLRLFFGNEGEVYLARIVYDQVKEKIKWENSSRDQGEVGAEGFFPHLYNGLRLGKSEIESVVLVKRGDGATWADELQAQCEAWLEY